MSQDQSALQPHGHPKFIQIAAGTDSRRPLFAIDEEGAVWHYIPADNAKGRYAFWSKLTGHRRNAADASKTGVNKL